MVHLFMQLKAHPNKRKELLLTIESLVAEMRLENDCANACCYQKVEDENDFLLFGQWATQRDAEALLASDIFTVLRGAEGLMAQKPKIAMHTIS